MSAPPETPFSEMLERYVARLFVYGIGAGIIGGFLVLIAAVLFLIFRAALWIYGGLHV